MVKKNQDYEPSFCEKCILHSIIAMSSSKNKFYQSNDRIAEIFDLTENSVKVMISHLVKNGYIKKERKDGYRYLYYTGKKFNELPVFANLTKAEAISCIKQNKKLKDENQKLKDDNAKLKQEIKELKEKLKSHSSKE